MDQSQDLRVPEPGLRVVKSGLREVENGASVRSELDPSVAWSQASVRGPAEDWT